jgi:hypothetical protein
MKWIFFTSLMVILSLAGCKQIVMWRYGMHEPREETPASVAAVLKSLGKPADNVYLFRDSAGYCRYMDDSVFHRNLLGALFFTDRGLMYNYKDPASCQWSAGRFIGSLRADTAYAVDTGYRYQDLLKVIVPLEPGVGEAPAAGAFDYTVVITWGCFLGRYNERLFMADSAAAVNTRARIRVICLCADMMKAWSLRDDQKLKFRY